MTDRSNLARLVRDPSTGEMEWLQPSTDSLDLETLPERLDDATMGRVQDIARRPLCALPPAEPAQLSRALRMMVAVLPKRQSDEISGELFVEAYQRQLGEYPHEAINFLCDEATRTCRWFPTIAECLEMLSRWRRNDEAVKRKARAEQLLARERQKRRNDEAEARQAGHTLLSDAEIAAMPAGLIRIGLAGGWLVQDANGNVTSAPAAA